MGNSSGKRCDYNDRNTCNRDTKCSWTEKYYCNGSGENRKFCIVNINNSMQLEKNNCCPRTDKYSHHFMSTCVVK